MKAAGIINRKVEIVQIRHAGNNAILEIYIRGTAVDIQDNLVCVNVQATGVCGNVKTVSPETIWYNMRSSSFVSMSVYD